jgi:maltose O-acetyltransferase
MFLIGRIKRAKAALLEKRLMYLRQRYVKKLRRNGITIGEGTIIYDPKNTVIDQTAPSLLSIGKYVSIATGCKILVHDSSWRVMLGFDGIIPGNTAKTVIGNNVFLGMNTIVLRGVTIGNNVIVGAGSVVTKDLDSTQFMVAIQQRN